MTEGEERKPKKDYGIGLSLKMLFRGFIDMLRLSIILSVVTVFIAAVAMVYLLATNFDGAVRILGFLGINL